MSPPFFRSKKLSPIKVLIVDDSPIVRSGIKTLLGLHLDIKVVGEASDGKEGVLQTKLLLPDLIFMDLEMPLKNGVDAIKEIMQLRPTPIIAITGANIGEEERNLASRALLEGAIEVIQKKELIRNGNKFIEKLRKIVQFHQISGTTTQSIPTNKLQKSSFPNPKKTLQHSRILLIGSSAGGPKALLSLLSNFSSSFPLPIVITQHIPPSFSSWLADWLDENCKILVRLAEQGQTLVAGEALIAPPSQHLIFRSNETIQLESADPKDLYCPSISKMMSSGAKVFSSKTIGVILTGMGEDGASGLLDIYKEGGYTFAEDRSTCAVFGMPKRAIEAGGVREVLPGNLIGEKILELLKEERNG